MTALFAQTPDGVRCTSEQGFGKEVLEVGVGDLGEHSLQPCFEFELFGIERGNPGLVALDRFVGGVVGRKTAQKCREMPESIG